MGDRRGLTMIEMLVVVAVLAAIAALAYPKLDGWAERERVNQSLAQIGAGVAAGRARARESGKPVEVRLSSGHSEARAERADTAGGAEVASVKVELSGGLSARRGGNEGGPEKPDAGGVVLAVCLPDGTVESAGAASLVAKNRTIDLTVSRWTGAVRGADRPLPGTAARGSESGGPARKAGAP